MKGYAIVTWGVGVIVSFVIESPGTPLAIFGLLGLWFILRPVDARDGSPTREERLAPMCEAAGLTVAGDSLYAVTWYGLYASRPLVVKLFSSSVVVSADFALPEACPKHLKFEVVSKGETGALPWGDPILDAVADVKADHGNAAAVALLSATVRAFLVSRFREEGGNDWRLRVEPGRVAYTLRSMPSEAALKRCFDQITDDAAFLDREAQGFPALLAETLLDEPIEVLRTRTRDVLLLLAMESPQAKAAASDALVSDHPLIRIAAAHLLNKTTESLVLDALPLVSADAYRAHEFVEISAQAALEALDFESDRETVSRLFGKAQSPDFRSLVLDTLVAKRPTWGTEFVLALFESHDALRLSLLGSLEALGDSRAEAALLSALESADEPTTIAIINALGVLGTVVSVPVLRGYCDEFFDSLYPKDAARGAIEAIQNRIDGAERGQLSLHPATDAAGGLSDVEG